MNIYILLRVILHSLLSAINLLALTAAAWSVSSQGGGQPRAAPGAVLVIIGSVAFVVLALMIWAECCIPRTSMSRVRTELALVPLLIVFQLLSAAIATSNTVQSVCRDPTSCITLLVLSWVAPFCLTIYYLIIVAVTLDHAKSNPNIWDASPLDHPWFLRPPHPLKTLAPLHRLSVSPPISLRTQPSVPNHRRQRSSWMPPTPPPLPPLPLPPVPAAQRDSAYSTRSSQRYIPKWARALRPLRRGIEMPFPVRSRTPTDRWEDPRRIDAPVSPSLYSEFP